MNEAGTGYFPESEMMMTQSNGVILQTMKFT
jgi:hypothetical protein